MASKIVLVVGFILSLVMYMALRSRNSTLRKNIQPGTNKTMRTVLLIAMIVVGLFLLRWVLLSFKSEGEGALFSPVEQAAAPEAVEVQGEKVTISVSGEKITVDGEFMENLAETEKTISRAVQEGKTFVLVDDYAENTTYLAVKTQLAALGVKADQLEEVKNQ